MAKFRTMYDPSPDIFVPSGSKIESREIFDVSGELIDTVSTDLDAAIQVNKDSGNVSLILEKYALGDDSYLNAVDGFYDDISEMQDMTIHDVHSGGTAALDFYNSLPDEIKAVYPSAEDFYNNFDYDSIVNAVPQDSVEQPSSEVNDIEE